MNKKKYWIFWRIPTVRSSYASIFMNKLKNIWNIIASYQVGIFNKYWWEDFWYNQISTRIWPRQKWLTKHISRTWMDKDTLMEICIFECIKNFVEGEKGLKYWEEHQKCTNYPKSQKIFEKEMAEMYQLVTVKLPELEKEMEKAYDAIPHWDFSSQRTNLPDDEYKKIYGPINQLKQEINNLKTHIMIWSVKNRGEMWT